MFFIHEIFNLLLTAIILGILFSRNYNLKEIFYWAKIAGLSVILHELAHKIVAELLGYEAFYNVFYPGLLIGLIFRLLNSPFIVFIPGYVEIKDSINYLHLSAISLAGPITNFLLFVSAHLLYKKMMKKEYEHLKVINIYLFILNMLPVPPLDGFKVIYGIYKVLMAEG